MARATERVGLVCTVSTTFFTPFHAARMLASLDHISGGRAGWNVVTSMWDSEARNHGYRAMPTKDERYERAREFVEVARALWASWDEDAVTALMQQVEDKGGAVKAIEEGFQKSEIERSAYQIALEIDGGVVRRARIGLGGVAATPLRARDAERALEGRPWTRETVVNAAKVMATEGTPMDDHRASSRYRAAMLGTALVLVGLIAAGMLVVSMIASAAASIRAR